MNTVEDLKDSLVRTVQSLEFIARSPALMNKNVQFYARIPSQITLPDLVAFVEDSAAYIAGRTR